MGQRWAMVGRSGTASGWSLRHLRNKIKSGRAIFRLFHGSGSLLFSTQSGGQLDEASISVPRAFHMRLLLSLFSIFPSPCSLLLLPISLCPFPLSYFVFFTFRLLQLRFRVHSWNLTSCLASFEQRRIFGAFSYIFSFVILIASGRLFLGSPLSSQREYCCQ